MNDDDLMTAVRESFTDLRSATPVERIVNRGRTVRARRRIPVAAGALALVAGAAVAATAVAGTAPAAGHQPGHPVRAQLAAWTVARHADGDIYITVNQLQDPAGLQSTLRADGLPVNVSFSRPPLPASCQPYNPSRSVLRSVATFSTGGRRTYLVIHPSALPSGVGVAIFDDPGTAPSSASTQTQGDRNAPPPGITGPLAIGLVYASPQCTG
jgi:hypothetical protein